MSSLIPQSSQVRRETADVLSGLTDLLPTVGGRTELHVLASVRVGGEGFVRCSCGWHQRFEFDVPVCCGQEDAEIDATHEIAAVTYRERARVAQVSARSRKVERELAALLGVA